MIDCGGCFVDVGRGLGCGGDVLMLIVSRDVVLLVVMKDGTLRAYMSLYCNRSGKKLSLIYPLIPALLLRVLEDITLFVRKADEPASGQRRNSTGRR